MRERMLMLGTSNGSIEILKYARSQGIHTIVTDYLDPENSFAKRYADEYWMISTSDIDLLEERCRKEKITAVICGVSEYNQDQVNRLTRRLCLPCYCTEKAWAVARNKAEFKKICKSVGMPVAEDFYLSDALTKKELDSVVFPVVVKPVDQCSNCGISFCNNEKELVKAYQYARSVSDNQTIIVEKKLQGNDWIAVYVLAEGEAAFAGLYVSYYEPGRPSYCYSINTTAHKMTDLYLKETNEKAMAAIKKMGCREGVCWVQLLLNEDGKFYAIETGYRLMGDFMFLPMRKVVGFDYIKWMVECACGRKHTVEELPIWEKQTEHGYACTYILWSCKAGTVYTTVGLDQLAEMPHCLLAGEVIKIGKYVEAYRPLCTIAIETACMEQLCEIIGKINELVSIKDRDRKELAIFYTDFESLKRGEKMKNEISG